MLSGKKTFITTGGGVGDLIMLTFSLYKLKNLYLSCKLSILTKQQTVEVINRIPWIDYVIGVKRGTFMSRFRVLLELSQQDSYMYGLAASFTAVDGFLQNSLACRICKESCSIIV